MLMIAQMEDIQRVMGAGTMGDAHQGYEDDFSQGYYNDEGHDKSDLEYELVSNPDSDGVEVPSIEKRHAYSNFFHTADISSDEPMDDYISSDNDNNNNLRGRFISKSANKMQLNSRSKLLNTLGSPLESLRQSVEDEELLQEDPNRPILPSITVEPRALISQPNSRPSSNMSADKVKQFHEAEVLRFRECISNAHLTLTGRRAAANKKALQEYFSNCALLVDSFTYKAMLQNVFDILLKGDWIIPPVDNHEPQLEADIPSDVYRVIRKASGDLESLASVRGRLLEAHNYLDINHVIEAEIVRRKSLPRSKGTHEIMADIKFDIACVANNRTQRDLTELRTTSEESYTTMINRANRTRQYGLRVALYTNSLGSSASLLIWPSIAVQAATRFPLIRLNYVFLEGILNFIKGSREFQSIRNLINHLSTWFEGWMAGTISSKMATEQLESFLKTCHNNRPPREKSTVTQISSSTSTRHEPGNELQQFIEMFAEIPRASNVIYSTVGIAGNDMSLNITDMESLGSQRQLTERAIEAVLATTKFPEGVMFARASGYGSLYDQQEYVHERSMSIHQGVKTILCPVHTGDSTQHWVGVVVRLDYNRRGRPGISAMLLDSMGSDIYNAVYDEKVIKKIVVTWLRHRLPDFKSFPTIGELVRPRVEQQVDPNSCGVHMLLNLRAAGLDSKYISKGDNRTSKQWIDDARESFVKGILRSAGKHLGGDIQSTINELLDESGLHRQERQTSNASASRVVSPHLGS